MAEIILNANSLHIPLADESVDCCITSPPYFALRDYGVDGQLGLENSPDEYIANMVAVFREVWRILKPHGTLWLNIGDSYAGSGGAGGDYAEGGLRAGQPKYDGTARQVKSDRGKTSMLKNSSYAGAQLRARQRMKRPSARRDREPQPRQFGYDNYKPKDLIGIPWMLAFALRNDGWYLRSDIIWAKPNPMPESVTDRPTKSHEYLFLLSKQPKYYYDTDAVREPVLLEIKKRAMRGNSADNKYAAGSERPRGVHANTMSQARENKGYENMEQEIADGNTSLNPSGRNRRSVWNIATQPYRGAHFAAFPEALVEPCIKAGTSNQGVCPDCGAPWERVVERSGGSEGSWNDHAADLGKGSRQTKDGKPAGTIAREGYETYKRETVAWQPTCAHDAEPVPAIVFDPFLGSGTTALVARQLGRHAIGTDLSFAYLHEQARARLQLEPAYWEGARQVESNLDDLPMFGGAAKRHVPKRK